MLWTKRTHQSTIFWTIECFNEISPSFSCHFRKHKVKSYLSLTSLFSVMKDNSCVFFYLKPLYFWQKEPIEVKFSDFLSGWVKIHQISYAMFETTSQFFFKLICCFKNDKEFGEFCPKCSKISKSCTLIGSFCEKYIIFDLKKYRGVTFHDTQEWCKNAKTGLSFEKWHEEFGEFSLEHLKMSKMRLWRDPFVQRTS